MSIEHVKKIRNRPLSWSSISSWEWSREQWAKKYLDDIPEPKNPELIFGSNFAHSVEDGTCKVKELMDILQDKKEQEFRAKFGDIELVGYADSFCDKTFKILQEIKTGVAPWTQKRVDEHRQLTNYCLLNYLINGIKPEETLIELFWIPTEKKEIDNGDFSSFDYSINYKYPITVQKFKTKRTLMDIMQWGAYVKKTVKEMETYALEYK